MPAQGLLCPTPTPGFHQQDAITQACCQDLAGSSVDGHFTEILKCECNLWIINSFSLS